MEIARIQSGELRHLIALQRYTESRSASGHPTRTWSTYASVWAKIETWPGGERQAGPQIAAVQTHRFTIRYDSALGIRPDHRILYDSRYFAILEVADVDERHVIYRLRAGEVQAAGPVSSSSPSSSPSASASSSVSA